MPVLAGARVGARPWLTGPEHKVNIRLVTKLETLDMTMIDTAWTLTGPILLAATLSLNLWLLCSGAASLRRAFAGPGGLVQSTPPTGEAQVLAFRPRAQAGFAPVSSGAGAPRRRAA